MNKEIKYLKKLKYILHEKTLSQINKKNKYCTIENNIININTNSINYIFNMEELKKMNNAIGGYYKVGIVGDRTIAIIGLPKENIQIEKIKFKEKTNEYFSFTEKDALEKEYIIFPFFETIEINNKLQECLEEIKDIRLAKVLNCDLELVKKAKISNKSNLISPPKRLVKRKVTASN